MADWSILINIIFVLHFFVGHKLQCPMRDAKHSRNETLSNTIPKYHFNPYSIWELVKNQTLYNPRTPSYL